jgi:hypothetical protein
MAERGNRKKDAMPCGPSGGTGVRAIPAFSIERLLDRRIAAVPAGSTLDGRSVRVEET